MTDSLLDFKPAKFWGSVQEDKELASTAGIDHGYVTSTNNAELTRSGCLSAPKSGRTMTLYTNQPSVQIHGAKFLQGEKGRDEQVFANHQATCIEPQQVPDGPNQIKLINDPWIKPGQVYHHISHYQFGNSEFI